MRSCGGSRNVCDPEIVEDGVVDDFWIVLENLTAMLDDLGDVLLVHSQMFLDILLVSIWQPILTLH